MEDIGRKQLDLIKNAKKYITNLEKKNVNTALSSVCYMQTFGDTPGFVKLKKLNKDSNFSEILSFIKNFIAIKNIPKYELKGKFLSTSYEYLFVSWATKKDFLNSGKYIDRYFNITSKNKKILWILIYTDEEFPRQLDKNILILSKKKTNFFYQFFFVIQYFFKIIKNSKFNLKNIYHQLSEQTCFAYMLSNVLDKKFKLNNIRKVFFPFESQPFQNLIINNLKKKNKDLKIIGYDHSIDALPINNIYKKYSPDILYVHSHMQKNIYTKYLYWPLKKVKKIPSTRFVKKEKYFFSQKIFLPYNISGKDELIDNLEFFLSKKIEDKIKPLSVKIHPFQERSHKHTNFKNDIMEILKKFRNKFSSKAKKRISVFFGATSSVIEALQNGCEAIHIVSDPVFDSYTNKLWPFIRVKKISKNIFHYSLKSKNKGLILRKKKNFINNIELKT